MSHKVIIRSDAGIGGPHPTVFVTFRRKKKHSDELEANHAILTFYTLHQLC